MCVYSYLVFKFIFKVVFKFSSVVFFLVIEVIILMGNVKLIYEVIFLEISKKGLLEFFFFFKKKMKSLFFFKGLF